MGRNLNIVVCPNVATCEIRSKATEEEKQKCPDLYCPCERPHYKTRFCTDNKCCAPCVPVSKEVYEQIEKGKIIL